MSEGDVERSTKRERCISEIVAGYVRGNHVPRSDLPALIAAVADAVDGIAARPSPGVAESVVRPTETEIRNSIQRDRLVSFIDGKPYKALRRHLLFNGHTAESYRIRYGLPIDYPMVAASYSELRTELSKQNMARRRQLEVGRRLQ